MAGNPSFRRDDVSVGVGGDDGVDGGFGHRAEPFLALAQSLLALGHRARHPVECRGELSELVPLAHLDDGVVVPRLDPARGSRATLHKR